MDKKRVLILDTSVLCCWLQVPGKEETGPADDRWNHARIDALLQKEKTRHSTFVLPIATLIETGNHIAQAPKLRFERAQALAHYLREAAQASRLGRHSPINPSYGPQKIYALWPTPGRNLPARKFRLATPRSRMWPSSMPEPDFLWKF